MIKSPNDYPYATGRRGAGSGIAHFHNEEWGWRAYQMDRQEFDAAISVIVRQLRRYDAARRRLENKGGSIAVLMNTMKILNEALIVQGRHENHKIVLADQGSIRHVLHHEFWPYECRLEVRKHTTGMPVYYLVRISSDHQSEYSLIIEDLFRSNEYPIFDERFVKLMWSGHEVYFLRLSQFRQPLLNSWIHKKEPDAQDTVDQLLLKVGRHVFQACWHEDQFVGMAAAGQFGLENFRHAIELLYLSLSAELCDLRSAIDDDMLRFFSKIYDQPAILAFLERLTHLDGKTLAELPQIALKLYPALARTFSRFLSAEVPWGQRPVKVPLYKLIFANFSRLASVRTAVVDKLELQQAADVLEKQSHQVIHEILKVCGHHEPERYPAHRHLNVVNQ